MRATAAILGTEFGLNIFRRLEFPLGWLRHVWPDYKIPPVGNANGNLLQKRCLQNYLLVAGLTSVEALIGTRFMNRYVNSTRCIDRQEEFTKGKLPPSGSAPEEPTAKRLESMDNDCSGPTTDTSTKYMEY